MPDDDNTAKVDTRLAELAELWERDNILPTEEVPHGDDQRPHQYGMPRWRDMFSPRQLLGPRVLRPGVPRPCGRGPGTLRQGLTRRREAAWCYVALGD